MVGANIAEAWQKRRYSAHFVSKLTGSDGEQAETQHWIETAHACGYISHQESMEMFDECRQIGGMLATIISKPEKFCRGRED